MKTHLHTCVADILFRGHPYISLPIGNDNKKIKRFLSKSKGCRVVKYTTGQQCKLTKEQAWNGNTIDLLTDHRSLHQWLLWLTIASSASCC